MVIIGYVIRLLAVFAARPSGFGEGAFPDSDGRLPRVTRRRRSAEAGRRHHSISFARFGNAITPLIFGALIAAHYSWRAAFSVICGGIASFAGRRVVVVFRRSARSRGHAGRRDLKAPPTSSRVRLYPDAMASPFAIFPVSLSTLLRLDTG